MPTIAWIVIVNSDALGDFKTITGSAANVCRSAGTSACCAATRMQPLGDRHPIRINAPEKLSLIADKDRIEQVLANLLSNAIRYSPQGGPIEVDAETTGDGVHIRVRDRGLGIPREHQQLVFERFGRAHGTAFGGLGLGLAISKGIVERHGGRIWVESAGRPGEGSVFHVQLPLVTPPAQT